MDRRSNSGGKPKPKCMVEKCHYTELPAVQKVILVDGVTVSLLLCNTHRVLLHKRSNMVTRGYCGFVFYKNNSVVCRLDPGHYSSHRAWDNTGRTVVWNGTSRSEAA